MPTVNLSKSNTITAKVSRETNLTANVLRYNEVQVIDKPDIEDVKVFSYSTFRGVIDTEIKFVLEALVDVKAGNPLAIGGPSRVTLADKDLIPDVFAISTQDVEAGQPVSISEVATVNLSDWSEIAGSVELDLGKKYYLSNNGMITAIPPTTGYLFMVGVAINTNELRISLGTPVKLT